MCIGFIKKSNSKTIVLLNRDEFYSRETKPMSIGARFISGIDIKCGGTWLAIDKSNAQFSFVTNIRNKSLFRDDKESRGVIPGKLLLGSKLMRGDHNPFNAILGSKEEFFYQNYLMDDLQNLVLGCEAIGISNGVLPSHWPKVKLGVEALNEINDKKSTEELIPELLGIMSNTQKFDFVPGNTGFTDEEEHLLSSIFIESPDYGTVSTTILIYDEKSLTIYEKDYISKCDFIHTLNLE
jgi:uncharacterized protein with NRDE domain